MTLITDRHDILSKLSVADRYRRLQEIDKELLMPEGDDFLPGGRFYAGDEEWSNRHTPSDREEKEGELDKAIRRERAAEKRRGW